MAGNSRRRGATRKPGTKKGAIVGSGGQQPRGLRGRGPTPPAKARKGHPAARRAPVVPRAAEAPATPAPPTRAQRPAPNRRPGKPATELVTGRNAVVEALRARVPASALLVAERLDGDDRVREAMQLCADLGVALMEVPRAELDRISAGAHHQGLALQIPPYEYAHPAELLDRAVSQGEPALVVALDGVTDPRNLGAVVRSAAAFGGHGVLVPERRAAGMTAGAWKASAGAAARLPVARATNLSRALASYQKAGLLVVGLTADGDVDLAEFDAATDPLCVVVGSEGRGLSRLVAQSCDLRVRIPMAGGTESLNAGVAAGIVLYEIACRRSRTRASSRAASGSASSIS
jgi:23S rRNA (guanosine2251-2'-O)-methyltransferase